MKLPIILNENSDLLLFSSEEELTSYIEPIDVKNNEYVAYDANGKLLSLLVEAQEYKGRLFGKKTREIVKISSSSNIQKPSELKSSIEEYLINVNVLDKSEALTLSELIFKLKEFLRV
ncbi:MAG: hypothetical protein GKR92_07500 [Gammaproteobacteria bacterium]|nr:MAG: hypothetical protein GKR92_07500 [Gammaproteobacteria bacterium]